MIEKRLVQWYAADAGIDLDIAERDIVLTYVLRLLADRGFLNRLAFKGGTAIRKLYLGNQGRFSLDLDFTALEDVNAENFILDVVGALHEQKYFDLAFTIPATDYYVTPESCGAQVSYQHSWITHGTFDLQISLRAKPLLPVKGMTLKQERYFEWLGIDPPIVPTLDLHEIIGEKIRAAFQRSRVRDLYDLYQLSSQRFDRDKVRRIAVIKCWETRFAFNTTTFWERLRAGNYNWGDLRRLARRGWDISPETIISGIRQGYSFLEELTEEETLLAVDAYQRQDKIYHSLVNGLQSS